MGLWTRLRLTRQPDGTSPWWGIAILLAGVLLVLFGWLWEGTWEDVFIEVGAAAGVGGIVLLFKPRLMRQVREEAKEEAVTTATAIVTTATDELTSRVVRLENIGDVQANVQERLQEEAEQAISATAAEISYDNIERQLMVASQQSLFSDRILVKTSRVRGHPLMGIQWDDTFDTPGNEIWLTIWCLYLVEDEGESFQEIDDDEIAWQPEEDVSSLIQSIVLKYRQLGLPEDDLATRLLFDHLQDSYRLMVTAQQEPPRGGRRVSGKLVFLINAEWVLTDRGLESINTDHFFRWGQKYGPNAHILLDTDRSCPEGCQESLWEEALYYTARLDKLAPQLLRVEASREGV